MKILLVVVGIILVVILIDAANRARTRQLRESGVYPQPGQGTDGDVERLVMLAKKISAIKLYREINGVELKTAKEAVEKLTMDLQQSGYTKP
jgi:ribosomal protein L7/L12